jgi:hypothetical protein
MIHSPTGALAFQPYGTSGQAINSVSRAGLNMMLLEAAEQQAPGRISGWPCPIRTSHRDNPGQCDGGIDCIATATHHINRRLRGQRVHRRRHTVRAPNLYRGSTTALAGKGFDGRMILDAHVSSPIHRIFLFHKPSRPSSHERLCHLQELRISLRIDLIGGIS